MPGDGRTSTISKTLFPINLNFNRLSNIYLLIIYLQLVLNLFSNYAEYETYLFALFGSVSTVETSQYHLVMC